MNFRELAEQLNTSRHALVAVNPSMKESALSEGLDSVEFLCKDASSKISRGIVGVYFLKNNGNFIYVGMSNSCVRQRIRSHVNKKDFNEFGILNVREVLNRYECKWAVSGLEKNFIKLLKPPLNIRQNENNCVTSRMYMRVTVDEKNALTAAAEKEGKTITQLIRGIIRERYITTQ